MPCVIQNCPITDASFLMRCIGSCGRTFHAACAGTQRNYESTITNYMVPLCLDCQATVSSEITTRDVLTRQQSLTGTIEAMIDANHKACSASKNIDFKIETVQGACEGIVTLLSDMQQQLDRLDKKIDDSALNLYNKVSTFFDESAPVDNADTVAKIETLTSATYKIGEGQRVIDERLKVINQGLISLSERDHGPAVAAVPAFG